MRGDLTHALSNLPPSKLTPEERARWIGQATEEDFARYLTDVMLTDDSVEEGLRFLREGAPRTLLKTTPVDVETFLLHPHYMGGQETLYPAVLEELIEINSGKYTEVVLTGSIGVAKSTIALYSQAYQVYLLSCYTDPHQVFGLDPASEIVIAFQTLTFALAKSVDFARFRSMMLRSPYFSKPLEAGGFPFRRDLESELRFPHNIIVRPVSSKDTGTVSQNVIGAVIDEINLMAVVDKSKRTIDNGLYDQAAELYRTVARRRESRFMSGGTMPGLVCLVSSKKYPGEFTDQKIEEAQTNPKIYVYDKKLWDIKPAGTYSDETFRVFTGDFTRNPRILTDEETLSKQDAHLVLEVPVDFRTTFEADIHNALRDIGGVSVMSAHPFLPDVERVSACFDRTEPVLTRDWCDFADNGIAILPDNIKNPKQRRWLHLDLALTSDSAGLACGYVERFEPIDRGQGLVEMLPHIVFDFILEVRPPRGGEIIYQKIRKLIYLLMAHGLNIKYATADTYQSSDMLQMLRQYKIGTANISMDKTTAPYDVLKSALYDQRISAPKNDVAQRELLQLERDMKKGKIDHPPQGSKDMADAMAGVVYGLTLRRRTWLDHGIPINRIPGSVQAILDKVNIKENEGAKI